MTNRHSRKSELRRRRQRREKRLKQRIKESIFNAKNKKENIQK